MKIPSIEKPLPEISLPNEMVPPSEMPLALVEKPIVVLGEAPPIGDTSSNNLFAGILGVALAALGVAFRRKVE